MGSRGLGRWYGAVEEEEEALEDETRPSRPKGHTRPPPAREELQSNAAREESFGGVEESSSLASKYPCSSCGPLWDAVGGEKSEGGGEGEQEHAEDDGEAAGSAPS